MLLATCAGKQLQYSMFHHMSLCIRTGVSVVYRRQIPNGREGIRCSGNDSTGRMALCAPLLLLRNLNMQSTLQSTLFVAGTTSRPLPATRTTGSPRPGGESRAEKLCSIR